MCPSPMLFQILIAGDAHPVMCTIGASHAQLANMSSDEIFDLAAGWSRSEFVLILYTLVY